jgi:hypothetical protein
MPVSWSITAEWEPLDSGPPEEKACFAALGIQAHGIWLTEGLDSLANSVRKAPRLSAYHLAEWIAWNWWRLRWEPRSTTVRDWSSSHRMTTIGGGYIWPNITIFSDGERIALIAKPTEERPQTPFRYIADMGAVLQANEFEDGTDTFIGQVLERLDSQKITKTNLRTIWEEVLVERRTPLLMRQRKLEALLGEEPDEADPNILRQLVADSEALGSEAVDELAADHVPGASVATAQELRSVAIAKGHDASPRNAVRLATGSGLARSGQVPAWLLGADAARALREQERLNGQAISDRKLAELAGTQTTAIIDRESRGNISFALDESPMRGRIVLRSKWGTGRRFELARILGDRIARQKSSQLFPATRAYTYRQKMQRSFAAELLSPFDVVDEMLNGDYSLENQQEVADHFNVSPMTIRTSLVNHRRIERDSFDFDVGVA